MSNKLSEMDKNMIGGLLFSRASIEEVLSYVEHIAIKSYQEGFDEGVWTRNEELGLNFKSE